MGIFTLLLLVFTGAILLMGFASAKVFATLLPLLIIAFIIKNIVQDVWFGVIKNRLSFERVSWNIVCDFARLLLFFYPLGEMVGLYNNSSGLFFFDNVLGILFYFVVGGILFLTGELAALQHSGSLDMETSGMFIMGEVSLLVLLCGINLFFML